MCFPGFFQALPRLESKASVRHMVHQSKWHLYMNVYIPVSFLGMLCRFPKLHINNAYFQDEILIDEECNGQYDADAEGSRLSGGAL